MWPFKKQEPEKPFDICEWIAAKKDKPLRFGDWDWKLTGRYTLESGRGSEYYMLECVEVNGGVQDGTKKWIRRDWLAVINSCECKP